MSGNAGTSSQNAYDLREPTARFRAQALNSNRSFEHSITGSSHEDRSENQLRSRDTLNSDMFSQIIKVKQKRAGEQRFTRSSSMSERPKLNTNIKAKTQQNWNKPANKKLTIAPEA